VHDIFIISLYIVSLVDAYGEPSGDCGREEESLEYKSDDSSSLCWISNALCSMLDSNEANSFLASFNWLESEATSFIFSTSDVFKMVY